MLYEEVSYMSGQKQKIAICVSGGGTNLQAIIDKVNDGTIRNTEISIVISNKPDAYALERAKKAGIDAVCISPKGFENRDDFANAMVETLKKHDIDLVVLAGYLVIVPVKMIHEYRNRIINIHPSLIPAHCGMGYYGLKVHESVLATGNKVTGATVHFVNEIPDGGEIIFQKAVNVEDGDTPVILQKRVMEQAEWIILPAAAEKVAAVIAERGEKYGHL